MLFLLNGTIFGVTFASPPKQQVTPKIVLLSASMLVVVANKLETAICVCMCMCVYIYIYIYTYTHVYIYIYIYTHTYIYTCVRIYVCMYVCIYIHILCTHTHTHTHLYTHTCCIIMRYRIISYCIIVYPRGKRQGETLSGEHRRRMYYTIL